MRLRWARGRVSARGGSESLLGSIMREERRAEELKLV